MLNEGSLTGGPVHLAMEWFKMMTGVHIVHVPYRSAALVDLLSGRLQVSFNTIGVLAASVKNGKLRACRNHRGEMGGFAGRPDRR